MLPDRPYEEIVFFGGKDYLPLLCLLTEETPNSKTVFCNAAGRAEAPGWNLQRFETKTRTNWHCECAAEFLDFSDNRNTKHRELGYGVHFGRK